MRLPVTPDALFWGSVGGLSERVVSRGGLLGEKPDQLGPRPDVELAIDAAQVEIHGLRTQEEPRSDLLACGPVGGGEGHWEFLRCQLLGRGRVTPSKPLAAGAQLGSGPVCPRF